MSDQDDFCPHGVRSPWACEECEAADLMALPRLYLDLVSEASFLIARIDELDWSRDMEDFERDFHGHVAPSVARLRQLLSPKATQLNTHPAGHSDRE